MCLEERGVIFKSVMNKEMPVVSAPSDIWLEPPRPQTNADIAFAPTSVAHLDVLDIYGPNVFENYRRVMQENSVSETQFLDGLNQDTTAFPTLPCLRPVGTSFPVFTGSECEVNEMQARSHAITFFNERGEPLVPWFKTVQQEECSKMEKEKVGLVSDPNLVATEGQPPALGPKPQALPAHLDSITYSTNANLYPLHPYFWLLTRIKNLRSGGRFLS